MTAVRMTSRYNPNLLTGFMLGLMALCPGPSAAENAIRYTDALVTPGDTLVIEMIMENDIPVSGAFIPFRWSSADLELLGIVINQDRFQGVIRDTTVMVNEVERTSGVFFRRGFGVFDQGWIEPGSGVLARLRFAAAKNAEDQVAFIDSVHEDLGSGAIRRAEFSDLRGTQSIFPVVYPGQITIGSPSPAEIRVAPTSLEFAGTEGGDNPPSQSLSLFPSNRRGFAWILPDVPPAWLNAEPTIGKAPATLTVQVELLGLSSGQYTADLTIVARSSVDSLLVVPVTLTVAEAPSETVPEGVSGIALSQNHPNPFTISRDGRTTIEYYLAEPNRIELAVYDTLGQHVRTLFSGQRLDGEHSIDWDGRDRDGQLVTSGHYVYRLETSKGTLTRRMIVMK